MNRYIEQEREEEELFYSFVENDVQITEWEKLPTIVEEWTKDATQASNYNFVPASLTFFTMLGQLCKDMVAIPSGANIDDCRIQFLWLQTSGTGKSTLSNWFIPIVEDAFTKINDKYGTTFDVFACLEYTDAALIGSYKQEEQRVEDEDGVTRTVKAMVATKGALGGEGLGFWDEFENSGVFKQSQHKENAVPYFQTAMNSLWHGTWIITKVLKDGDDEIKCECKRSFYGTSYIPKTLTTVISEKGVLQRMIIFIWEVPQHIQKQMRRRLIRDWGTIKGKEEMEVKYSNAFVTLYETVKERYDEVGGDPVKVITLHPDAKDALLRECELMEEYITNSRQEVFNSVQTFINRFLKHIEKMAVLCCIAEAPSIKDKSQRFVVTQKHVIQSSSLIRNCYKSLVSWLDEALRVEKHQAQEMANIGVFKTIYTKLNTSDDGWVNKSGLLGKVRVETKKSQATIYKWYTKVEEVFDEKRMGGTSVYVRMKEENL